MAAKKGILKPRSDKQIKKPVAKKAPADTRIAVESVGSVRMLGDGAVVVADGKEQLIKGGKVSILIEG